MSHELKGALNGAHDALNRMYRAHKRGTGCHLTAAMIESLSLTNLGEVWAEPDPRAASQEQGGSDA